MATTGYSAHTSMSTPSNLDRSARALDVRAMLLPELLALAREMTRERQDSGLPIYDALAAQIDGLAAALARPGGLTDDERERITMDVMAARNFDDADPDYSRVLSVAAYRLLDS